jgi:hypothetical protein
LSRYGLSLSGGALAAATAEGAASAVPGALVSATLLAVYEQGAISASISILVKGALKTMLLTKLKLAVGTVMIAVAFGVSGLVYRAAGEPPSTPAKAADQAPSAPAEKKGGGKPPSELEALRQEVELLKLKLDVVQQKLRVQETELRAIRAGATDDVKMRAEAEPKFTTLQAAEFDLQSIGKQRDVYQRRYLSQLEQNRRVPGSVPKDEVEATRLQRDRYTFAEKAKVAELKRAWIVHRVNRVEIALKAVQYADDKESRQQAADTLEKAVQKLREELKKQDDPKNER